MQDYLAAMQALDLGAPFAGGDRVDGVASIESALRRALVPDRAYAGLWRAWHEAVSKHGELRPADRAIAAWMRAGVVALIEGGRAAGHLRPDLDVSATAAVINTIAWQLSQAPQEAAQDDAAVLAAAARMIYHAIFADSQP
jgi:hypothetical protein